MSILNTPVDLHEFVQKIQMHPCAFVRVGRVTDREKSTGLNMPKISGFTPHYAMTGCPKVEWSGDQPLAVSNGAQIEFHFDEDIHASIPGMDRNAWVPYGGMKKGTLVQLTYGRQNQAPTTGQYRVLREAGFVLPKIKASGKKVIMVAYSWLSPANMGAVTGRFHLLGIFSLEGEPLFVSPEAIENGIFKCEWPADQKERSLAAVAAPQPTASWYAELQSICLTMDASLKGKALHEMILKARATTLVQRGASPDFATALASVQAEVAGMVPGDLSTAPAPAPAAAPTKKVKPEVAPSSRSAAGKKMLGRSLVQVLLGRAGETPVQPEGDGAEQDTL